MSEPAFDHDAYTRKCMYLKFPKGADQYAELGLCFYNIHIWIRGLEKEIYFETGECRISPAISNGQPFQIVLSFDFPFYYSIPSTAPLRPF